MKTKRHNAINKLIAEHVVDTQEELLRLLGEAGYAVTQATVSRDIKELRLIKAHDTQGRYRYMSSYQDATNNIASKFHSLFTEAVISVDFALNTVVVKCYTGMAQAVCAALDTMHWDGVIGTLAGDDTIFIITRTENNALFLTGELRKLIP